MNETNIRLRPGDIVRCTDSPPPVVEGLWMIISIETRMNHVTDNISDTMYVLMRMGDAKMLRVNEGRQFQLLRVYL